jgi:hypothetical protein
MSDESKIRRVRTPAGRARFGQEIGEVIAPDIPVDNFEIPRDSPEEPEYFYRAVSEDDWQGIQERGFIQSDGRMNLGADEGTVVADRDPSWYLPSDIGVSGRIMRIRRNPDDGWWKDHDSYWKTPKPIPLDRVDAVTPSTIGNGYSSSAPSDVTPDDVRHGVENSISNAILKELPDADGYGFEREFRNKVWEASHRMPRDGATIDDLQTFLNEVRDLVANLDENDPDTPGIRAAVTPVLKGAETLMSSMQEHQTKSVSQFADLEAKIRHVRDVEYWGLPYNTPILPGMKPKPKPKRSTSAPQISATTVSEAKPKPVDEEWAMREGDYEGWTVVSSGGVDYYIGPYDGDGKWYVLEGDDWDAEISHHDTYREAIDTLREDRGLRVPTIPDFEWFDYEEEDGARGQKIIDPDTGITAFIVERGFRLEYRFEKDGEKIPWAEMPSYDHSPRNFTGRKLWDAAASEGNRRMLKRRMQYFMKRPYIKELETELKEAPERQTPGFADHYSGVYGIDWTDDGESLFTEDIDDPAERITLAKLHAQELGIQYVHDEGTEEEIHFESIELVNATMQSLSEIVYGLTSVTAIFGMDSTKPRSPFHSPPLAWATPVSRYEANPMRYSPGNIGTQAYWLGDGIDRDHAAIGLGRMMYGDDWNEEFVKQVYWGSQGSSWWSVNPKDVVDQTGMETWDSLLTSSLVHEVGHTVAFASYGYLRAVYPAPDQPRIPEDEWQVDFQARFRESMSDILADFGVIERGEQIAPDEFSWVVAGDKDQGKEAFGVLNIDRMTILDLLSEYGSVNINELAAETWAEYMLAPRPRPFAQAFGELLHDSFEEFIAHREEGQAQ